MKISDFVEQLREVPGALREAAEALRTSRSQIGELEKTAALRRVRNSFSRPSDSVDTNDEDAQTVELGGKLLEKLAGRSARRTALGEAGEDAPGGAKTTSENYLTDLRSM